MKSFEKVELKKEFVKLRAEGRSYMYIAEKLGINGKTCTKWNAELLEQIEQLQDIKRQELAECYILCKKHRLEVLSKTLEKLQQAVNDIDYSDIPPYKLLILLLRFSDQAKREYTPQAKGFDLEGVASDEAIEVLADLLKRVQNGEITIEQASQENAIVGNIIKAYDSQVLQQRIEELEKTIEGWKQ